MSDLPKNWEYGKLSQTAHVVRGITFPAGEKRNDLAQGYVCCLRTTNVQQKLEWDDVYYVPTSYVKRDEQLVCEGDVLMSMANSYELVGKVARAINVPQPAAFGAFLAAVRPTHAIDGGYLYHFLRSSEVQSKLREGSSQTTNIANISVGRLSELPVPLAPWSEQKRIADKLDTVLTRVDAVNTRLARAAPLLKRFRQSVLAAATSGRLTEDWRAQSQAPTRSTIALGDMVISIDQGWSPKCEANAAPQEQWAVIKTTAIQALHFYPEENKALPNNLDPRPHLALRDGDVLITRAGPRSRAGVTCIVTGDQPRLMLCDKAYRVRVDRSKIHPQMLNLLLNSPEVLDAIDEMKTGISESGVNLTQAKFRELALSVPHKEEQTEIIRRVETLFAFADRLEARLQTAQAAANRLTPALLAKAFRGELVPQDPNDEPASELLKRLAASATSSPTRRGRSKASKVN